jgi:membrane protein YdbS with pleckstrin-like domain
MMSSASNPDEFDVQCRAVQHYFLLGQILFILGVGIWLFGLGIPVAVVHAVTLGPWLSRSQAAALKYWIDGGTLRVDEGVFFLKRKAIPLDRVTDIVLAQGPLMRWCGIWGIQVQTAGTGQVVPEATLYGVAGPEQVRDRLLAARDKAVAKRKED